MVKETFESKLAELNKLIDEIEAGQDGLNVSIEKYAKAQKLADELAEMLGQAKQSLGIEVEETGNEEEEE